MKNNLPSYAYYRKEYETAKSLGAAALACNAIMIPTGHESLRLLIQNFTRPMATNNDAADVDYAGGLAAHIAGVPKTSFESSITVIETETGAIAKFAQAIVDNGGYLAEAVIVFGQSDGGAKAGATAYKIFDITITFSDGGGEIDASSRSQILTISGSLRYMYFGENANLGATGQNALNSINSNLANSLSGSSNDTASAIAGTLDGLVKLVQNGGFNVPSGSSVALF